MCYREQIKNKLINLGCNVTYRGFEFLFEILIIACEHEERLLNLKRNIYPEVALKHNTSAGNIDRAIRTLIASLDLEDLKKISNGNLRYIPTVKRFIGLLVEYINYGY